MSAASRKQWRKFMRKLDEHSRAGGRKHARYYWPKPSPDGRYYLRNVQGRHFYNGYIAERRRLWYRSRPRKW